MLRILPAHHAKVKTHVQFFGDTQQIWIGILMLLQKSKFLQEDVLLHIMILNGIAIIVQEGGE